MLVVPDDALLADLTLLRASWSGVRYCRLYQNDYTPDRHSTAEHFEEATFAGYTAGGELIEGWAVPWIAGTLALTQADPITWTKGAGQSNWIFGYYVVDASGFLKWAERRPGPAAPMIHAGTGYTVLPRFNLRSRFPLEV